MIDMPHRPEPTSRRDIDVAVGVLVGLRQCTQDEAFEEVARAAHRTGVGLRGLCRALVALASGTSTSFAHQSEAMTIWGDLTDTSR